jgi:hypothetical protein
MICDWVAGLNVLGYAAGGDLKSFAASFPGGF